MNENELPGQADISDALNQLSTELTFRPGNKEKVELEELLQSGLPFPGRLQVQLLRGAEIIKYPELGQDPLKYLEKAVDTALAFKTESGTGKVNLDSDPQILKSKNRMLTKEEASDRPRSEYVETQLEITLNDDLEEARIMRDEYVLWLDQAKSIAPKGIEGKDFRSFIETRQRKLELLLKNEEGITRLYNRYKATKIIDIAVRQRWITVEDPGGAAELLMKGQTPDNTHWESYFNNEWGRKMGPVLREIAYFGLPKDVQNRLYGHDHLPEDIRKRIPKEAKDNPGLFYINEIYKNPVFKGFLKRLYDLSGQRMDVVQAAWDFMLLCEVPGELAVATSIKDDKEEYKLGYPPIQRSLSTWITHFKKKRMVEWGVDKNGKRIRVEKYLSHSGHPASIELSPDTLVHNFLQNTKFKIPVENWKNLRYALYKLTQRLPSSNGSSDYSNERDKLRKLAIAFNNRLSGRGSLPRNEKGEEITEIEISLWDLWLYGELDFGGTERDYGSGNMVMENFPWFLTESDPESPGDPPKGSFADQKLAEFRAKRVADDMRMLLSKEDLAKPDFFSSRVRDYTKLLGEIKGEPEENYRVVWLMGLCKYLYGIHEVSVATRREIADSGDAHAREDKVTFDEILIRAKKCGFIRKEDEKWIYKMLDRN